MSSAHSRSSGYRSPYYQDYYQGNEEDYYQEEDEYSEYERPPSRQEPQRKRVNWKDDERLDSRDLPNNKFSVKVADKNLRVRNIDGRFKQTGVYDSINRMDRVKDAYFYPNPQYLIHPSKTLY